MTIGISFLWPLVLLLMPLWILLIYLLGKKPALKSGRRLIVPMTPSMMHSGPGKYKLILTAGFLCFHAGVLMVILSLARPGYYDTEVVVEGEGIDIIIALDLSSSMLAQDFEPDRLQVSKEMMKEFIKSRPVDRIGLVGFAGESFTQSPLTTDREIILDLVEEFECGMIADGTAIGMGLATSLARLRNTEEGSGVIILLTDGVNNTGNIDPVIAARMAQKMAVRVYTIGVGSIGVARAPVERRRDGTLVFGNVRVEIDEELLREISAMTGGEYFRADNEQALTEIYQRIDELEKTEVTVENIRHFQSLFRTPLSLGVILILLSMLPSIAMRKFP